MPVTNSRPEEVDGERPPLGQDTRTRMYRCPKCNARTRTAEVITGVFLDEPEKSINRLTDLAENSGNAGCECSDRADRS